MRQKRSQIFHGQRAFAKAVGVSQPRISQLIAQGRIQPKPSFTSADVKAARELLAEARAANNATAGTDDGETDAVIEKITRNPERVARIKLLLARTAKIELEKGLLAGEYLRKVDVEAGRLARVYAVRAKLAELPLRAALLVGGTEADIEKTLWEWVKEVCNHFAGGDN